jgi:ribonuclease-3
MSDDPARDALETLEIGLGYRFKDRALLEMALSHRSHAYEVGQDARSSYERLEFLGDSLLGLFVAEWLYRDDEQADEGALSRRRQSVVRASTLAHAAGRLGLDEAIKLGRGEERTGGRAKASLLADVFEAVVGAIFLDRGVRSARAFVRRALKPALQETRGARWTPDDFKTRLQEAVQARLRQTPRYRIVSSTGPDHALEFVAEVRVARRVLGRGSGTNRKRAEQEAARRALERLNHEDARGEPCDHGTRCS